MSLMRKRKIKSNLVLFLSGAAAGLGVFMLLWILTDVALKGASSINWSFFTELPAPPGMEGGGLANAIVGTLLMTLTASVLAVPFGLLAGTYLAEFGRGEGLGNIVRRLLDILVSAPSIVIGVFVYLLLVRPMGHFSGWAGAVSLAIIMLPLVARTTEEMLNLVPNEIREAALALGAPYWKVMLQVIYRSALTGIATGVLLALARITGETAPLLFTAMNSPYWPRSMNEPMANLTVTLFNYAMSPYEDWQRMAWGAALLITMAVLLTTIITRFVLRRRKNP